MDAADYRRAIQEDADRFAGAPVFYEGHGIVVLDVRQHMEPIGTPWPRRRLSEIRGLCLHHKAGWASYWRTNEFVRRHRVGPRRPYARLAYHLGVHHDPPRHDGRIVVYLFNPLTADSWASGAPARSRSEWYRQLPWRMQKDVNRWTVALSFNGFFASRWFAEGTSGRNIVTQPSSDQLRAAWGVVRMLEERCPSFERRFVLGHHDSGKVACPGKTAQAFAEAVRGEAVICKSDVERFIRGHDVVDPGWPRQGDSAEATGPVDFARVQRMLVELGYDLGPYGPAGDGVDGVWGPASRRALLRFEDDFAAEGTLSNGELDQVDVAAMEKATGRG